jgi:hypothetical protein
MKRHLENVRGFNKDANLDIVLRNSLTELFTLPSVHNIDSPLPNDLVIDARSQAVAWERKTGSSSFLSFSKLELLKLGLPSRSLVTSVLSY